jgi:ribosome maturation protein Sdo1
MDPKTKSPHPRKRIELAMDEAGVHVDPFKPVSEQVKTIIEQFVDFERELPSSWCVERTASAGAIPS